MASDNYRRWQPHEDVILADMRRSGHAWPSVGAELGRSAGSCATRFYYLHPGEKKPIKTVAEIDKATAAKREKREQQAIIRRDHMEMIRAERNSRIERTGDITAAFCGDPLPGYSALDRRRLRDAV